MADIVLLDGNGASSTYTGKETVTFQTPDGGEQVFETQKAREHPTVELDFSAGDTQEVTPSEGAVLGGVTINKPEALVPENIAKDVEIAGVSGELDAITAKAVAERTILGEIIDSSINSIGSYAFYGCSLLEKVCAENCVSMGTQAFAYCSKLSDVSLPLLSEIKNFAFYRCSGLETVTVGCNSNFYASIGGSAFTGCSMLFKLQFMYSGSIVDGKCFFNNLSGTNEYTFSGCSALESIHIIGKNSTYGGANGNAGTIPGYAFYGCIKLSDVKTTGQFGALRQHQSDVSKYFEIGHSAFCSCGELSYLSLSFSGIAGIGIGSYAFAYCSKLQDIWLNFGSFTSSGSKWAWLGNSAFYGTPIASSGLTGKFGSIHVTKNAYSYLRYASGWSAYSARMVSY